MLEIKYEAQGITLAFSKDKKQLVQTWTGFIRSAVFKETIDRTVQFVQNNEVESIISNTLEQKVLAPEDSQYAASTMPTLASSGLKIMAFVIPQKSLAQMAVKRFNKSQESPVELGFFKNLKEAEEWIDQYAFDVQ